MSAIRIALVGDHDPGVTAHRAIPPALAHAAAGTGEQVTGEWQGTAGLGRRGLGTLAEFDAIWCVPASPYADTAAALASIRYAREAAIPFLGTCGGFQHLVLEFARSVLGEAGAGHAELDGAGGALVIAPLSCELVEQRGSIRLAPGSLLAAAYGCLAIEEEYHCRYGLAPGWEERLSRAGLRVSARDAQGDVRAMELTGHPFFLGTLFQPERRGLRGEAPPPVVALVRAAAARRRALAPR